MGNRAFHAVVVLLWLSTMGWLVVAKILPPLRRGEPPKAAGPVDEIVCWQLDWNGRRMGWAASKSVVGEQGTTEVHSRVALREVPLEQMVPVWLGALVEGRLGLLDLDAHTRIEIDPLGRLVGFKTNVRLSDLEDAIRMVGRVKGSDLELHVRAGGLEYTTSRSLPPSALIANELSPQTELRSLRLGQTWTMPLYSPFLPPTSPVEILQAKVEREEFLQWSGKSIPTLVVVYRNDTGADVAAPEKSRGALWVKPDGTILQQEIAVLNSRMRFVRMSSEQAAEIAEELTDDWRGDIDSAASAVQDVHAIDSP